MDSLGHRNVRLGCTSSWCVFAFTGLDDGRRKHIVISLDDNRARRHSVLARAHAPSRVLDGKSDPKHLMNFSPWLVQISRTARIGFWRGRSQLSPIWGISMRLAASSAKIGLAFAPLPRSQNRCRSRSANAQIETDPL
jgi:hypothetical protein